MPQPVNSLERHARTQLVDTLTSRGIDRRTLLKAASLGLLGWSQSGWLSHWNNLRAEEPSAITSPPPKRHCILLWMTGGPTQTDTFDMKPDHANGGEFKPASTKVPGLVFSEHLPKLAAQADRLAIVRSLSTKEGDHGRGTHLMRTGHPPTGPVQYPSIVSSMGKSLAEVDSEIPRSVSISPYRIFNQAAFGPGFLGPRYAPLTVAAADSPTATPMTDSAYAELTVDDLAAPAGISLERQARRAELWRSTQSRFSKTHPGTAAVAHQTVVERALSLMTSKASRAFDLAEEPSKVRDAYGTGRFGQGCLMARRLIEQGVSMVEVTLGFDQGNQLGWDTHAGNFEAVKRLSAQLDQGWSTLMTELDERGLLESTTILWMGEFGRTPTINPQAGRDHFPAAWSCVLAGGGIKGGQAYGKTSDDGNEVVEGKVDVGDILATFATAAGINPTNENISDQGRPIKIAEGKPINDILS